MNASLKKKLNPEIEKYRAAFNKIFDQLPPWKREVILSKQYDDRIYNEFAKDVVIEAEQKEQK